MDTTIVTISPEEPTEQTPPAQTTEVEAAIAITEARVEAEHAAQEATAAATAAVEAASIAVSTSGQHTSDQERLASRCQALEEKVAELERIRSEEMAALTQTETPAMEVAAVETPIPETQGEPEAKTPKVGWIRRLFLGLPA